MDEIDDDSNLYLNDCCLEMFDSDPLHVYHAEQPKVHIRNGDDDKIHKELLNSERVSGGEPAYRHNAIHELIRGLEVILSREPKTNLPAFARALPRGLSAVAKGARRPIRGASRWSRHLRGNARPIPESPCGHA